LELSSLLLQNRSAAPIAFQRKTVSRMTGRSQGPGNQWQTPRTSGHRDIQEQQKKTSKLPARWKRAQMATAGKQESVLNNEDRHFTGQKITFLIK